MFCELTRLTRPQVPRASPGSPFVLTFQRGLWLHDQGFDEMLDLRRSDEVSTAKLIRRGRYSRKRKRILSASGKCKPRGEEANTRAKLSNWCDSLHPVTGSHLTLRIEPVLCLLGVSPAVACPGHGVPERKAWRRSSDQENQPPIVEVPAPVLIGKFFIESESDARLSENTRSVVPTVTQYAMATGKQALALLKSAANVIPVPLLKDLIEVAVKIIEVCEKASAVQRKVKELQETVGDLMIVIVDHVTLKYEEGSEVVIETAKHIEKDIEDLLSTLKTIEKELTQVGNQNAWLQGLYTDLNMEAVESCLNRLSTALEKFKLSNRLRDSNFIRELHARLAKIDNKIDDIHKGVQDISTYLLKSKQSATQLRSDTVVRHQIPLKPEIFHGRDDLVEEIARFLVKKETAHVCLLGPGGMGKTSVSLAVAELPLIKEQYPGPNCVWVPCIEATSAALLLEILYIQLQVPGDKQITLEKIISELNASEQRHLILLDNFETPWNAPGTGTQKQIEDILRQLAGLSHIAIFITMRGTNPPCNNAIRWQWKNIRPTDEEACIRIYHDNNPNSKDDPDVGRLVSVLGYMPFAVTLMAKLGMEAKSTAKELLDSWLESGPDIFADNPEESMNQSIRLSVESDLVKRNPNAIALLAILSLLPAGTTKQNLRWWALDSGLKTSMVPSAIATLSKAALLVENERQNPDAPVLFVLPVVQSFMQQHDRIEKKIRQETQSNCCQYVFDHACRYDDSAFPVKSKALAAEDTNIQSILFGSPDNAPSDRIVEALIAFSWHRSDTKPELEIANRAVKAAKAYGVKRQIVSAVWCLGWTYRQLGDHRSSYNHMQEAYLFSNDLSPGEVELQRLHCQCGIDLVEVAYMSLKDKGKAVSLARDVEVKCAALSDDNIHGWSLVSLGAALNKARQHEEALVHLKRARIMLKAVESTANLAGACQAIARVHCDEGRLPEALDAIQEAWKVTESSVDTISQALISLDSCRIHFNANRDTEAWTYTEIALMKASHVGDRLTMARALEYMGYGYLRRGDYENAYGAYEAAAEKFGDTVDAHVEKNCKDNMTWNKRKQRNPDTEIGFYRPSLDVRDKSLFYPLVQA